MNHIQRNCSASVVRNRVIQVGIVVGIYTRSQKGNILKARTSAEERSPPNPLMLRPSMDISWAQSRNDLRLHMCAAESGI